jgi:hypothetical protein
MVGDTGIEPVTSSVSTLATLPVEASDQATRCRAGMPISEQNLVVGMPASMRITSGSAEGPGVPRTSSTPAARPPPHPGPGSARSPRPRAAALASTARLPAAKPVLPASSNCRFQFPTDCSETFARRAASATVISRARIDNTIADLLPRREYRWSRHDNQAPRRSRPVRNDPARNLDARHPKPLSAAAATAGPIDAGDRGDPVITSGNPKPSVP